MIIKILYDVFTKFTVNSTIFTSVDILNTCTLHPIHKPFYYLQKVMAGYGGNNDYWAQQPPTGNQQAHQSYNFEVPEQFGQELYVKMLIFLF